MFSPLKDIVDLIRAAIADYRHFQSDKMRRESVLEILKVYYLLMDCVDEGLKLLSDAGSDPLEKLKAMDDPLRNGTLRSWNAALGRQTWRLDKLRDMILGQDHLTVIDPALQRRISQIVGSKMDGVINLQTIGAQLFFSNMFQSRKTSEAMARDVTMMAGQPGDTLSLVKAESEISELREALNDYRCVTRDLVSNDELLRLSRQARREIPYEVRAFPCPPNSSHVDP